MARLTDIKADRPIARPAPRPGRTGAAILERIVRYFREVWIELRKVDWPTRQELVAMTVVVIIVLLVLSLYLGLWDLVFRWLFQQILSGG